MFFKKFICKILESFEAFQQLFLGAWDVAEKYVNKLMIKIY